MRWRVSSECARPVFQGCRPLLAAEIFARDSAVCSLPLRLVAAALRLVDVNISPLSMLLLAGKSPLPRLISVVATACAVATSWLTTVPMRRRGGTASAEGLWASAVQLHVRSATTMGRALGSLRDPAAVGAYVDEVGSKASSSRGRSWRRGGIAMERSADGSSVFVESALR